MSDPQQMPIAKLEFEEARQLADCAAIFQDLTFVLAVLDRLQELHEEQGEDVDSVVIRAYWTAALIAYVRCFSSGKRLGLTETIFEDVEGGIDAHRRFKAMRDKHIAHSVNPFEQVDVGAVLTPRDSAERKVDGVMTLSLMLIGYPSEGIEQLQILTRIARSKTGADCKRLQEETQIKAGKMNLDKLYETATVRAVAPGSDDAAKPRS